MGRDEPVIQNYSRHKSWKAKDQNNLGCEDKWPPYLGGAKSWGRVNDHYAALNALALESVRSCLRIINYFVDIYSHA